MKGYDKSEAVAFMLFRLDRKEHRSLWKRAEEILKEFIEYDLHFMRLTGVLDENGEQGENDYDDDEAFEYIYDAWLGDHPQESDDEMRVAALLNDYMELQYAYLQHKGLAEV